MTMTITMTITKVMNAEYGHCKDRPELGRSEAGQPQGEGIADWEKWGAELAPEQSAHKIDINLPIWHGTAFKILVKFSLTTQIQGAR